MQTTQKRLNAYTIELTIAETARELDKSRDSVIADLRKNANIKGFRPGSDIPREIIVREYGQSSIDERAVDHYLRTTYPRILTKENIVPVAPGDIQSVTLDPFTITVQIEMTPEITLDAAALDSIRLTRTPVVITEDDVEARIREIESQEVTYRPGVDGDRIAMGDRVLISTQGYESKGGTALPDTRVEDFTLGIGTGQFIPGFEEKLIGHAAGETVEFGITFPADYHHEPYRSREVYFVTTIQSLEKVVRPEWDEAFIEKIFGEKIDMTAARERIRHDIEHARTDETNSKDEDQLLNKLIALANPEIGPGLLAREVDRIYAEHGERLAARGMRMQDYLTYARTTAEEYKDKIVKPEALRRTQAELLLVHVQTIRPFEVTDETVMAEVETILTGYQNETVVESLRKRLVPGEETFEDMRRRLAFRGIIERFFTGEEKGGKKKK